MGEIAQLSYDKKDYDIQKKQAHAWRQIQIGNETSKPTVTKYQKEDFVPIEHNSDSSLVCTHGYKSMHVISFMITRHIDLYNMEH